MKAKTALIFITEMINLLSFSNLGDNIKINFNFWHHFMAHMSVMIAIHCNKEIYSWRVLIVKNWCTELSPRRIRWDF